MSKDVIVNNEEYKGVSVIQLKTASGVAQFKDVNEATAGVLAFVDKGRIERTVGSSSTYWRSNNTYDALYTPAYEYGILLIDWEGTHAGDENDSDGQPSVLGIQTQMFVYTPTQYRYVGFGYRNGNGPQVEPRSNGIRTTGNLRTDEATYGNGNMYTGYINTNASACVAKEAQLTKEQADVFMAIMSGCYGYTAE